MFVSSLIATEITRFLSESKLKTLGTPGIITLWLKVSNIKSGRAAVFDRS